MDRHRIGRILFTWITVTALAAGCAAASPSPTTTATQTLEPSVAASLPPTVAPTAGPTPKPIVSEFAVSFESGNPLNAPGILDVFAPVEAGPWPVVVMFHGDPSMLTREYLRPIASRLAGEGFVIFAPNWGKSGGAAYDALSFSEMQQADNAQGACAIAFARAHAADYGGDPATMIVFGHSGGGNEASMQAFARPAPTASCLAGTEPSEINAFVVWEGDWVLGPSFWDGVLAEEPAFFDAITPWEVLDNQPEMPVHFVVSDKPGYGRADGPWLDTRGDGQFRSRFAAVGALDDGYLGLGEFQAMFAHELESRGNPVEYAVMPNSSHDSLSDEGMQVFVDAFKAAASG